MFLMNCPLPSYDGRYNATNVTIEGFVVVLNDSSTMVDFGGEGTVFRCSTDSLLTPPAGFQVQMTNKDYQATTLGFPSGWFFYAGDYIGASFQRINNMLILIGFFVLPTGFNIFGYGIEDLPLLALIFVISIYGLCYVFIGAMMYKIISPFAGVG